MDQPKVWRSSGNCERKCPPSQYTTFEISHTRLGDLNLVGFEGAVEGIVKRVLEKELKTLVNKIIRQKKPHPRVVCWTCKCQGHYSRDCKKNQYRTT